MKRYVAKKEEVETTSEIGKFCGFVTSEDLKGYLVYTGDCYDRLNAVLVEEYEKLKIPNTSCGETVTFASVEDFVQNANEQFSNNSVAVTVKDIYFFDSLKEMHRWLSE